jgi:hypothetical protein
MTHRKIYHVTMKEDGTWQGKIEKGERASIKGETKTKVLKDTIELAKRQGNASVIIHKTDGIIQEERTYPKKSDPFPPKG